MDYIHDQTMKVDNKWRQKSLEELERQDWGDPAAAPTNLVKRCIELSKVPVDRFTMSDLRLMIGQQFSVSPGSPQRQCAKAGTPAHSRCSSQFTTDVLLNSFAHCLVTIYQLRNRENTRSCKLTALV